MTDLNKTLAFVAVAVVLGGAAIVTAPSRAPSDAEFFEQGKAFFPEFADPYAATSMEVIDYDEKTARPLPFQVKLQEGQWVIPSHHNYAADAKDRLAKTSAGVIGLTKDTIRSDRAEDHEAFGVVDPLDTKVITLKGRGKRVTLKDTSDKILADLIIGKEVRKEGEAPPRDGSTLRYVRIPGQKRTYGVEIKADLSSKFADWIETNLLKLTADKIRSITIDNHKVDPERGTLEKIDVINLSRKDATAPWTIDGTLPDGKELDTAKINELTAALAELKIVGVRPKPPGLTRDLKTGQGLSQQARRSLQERGFYVLKDGSLLSNQGDLIVSTVDGAVYTLRYGEVTFNTGDALTAGDDATAEPKPGEETPKKPEGAGENRFLLVTVAFDPSLIPPPPPEPSPSAADGSFSIPENPDDVFERAPDDPKRVAEEKARADKADAKAKAEQKRIEDGQKLVQDLTNRFNAWYYVTPGESFRKLIMDRASLERAPAPAGGSPGSGPPGLPPGLFPPGSPH